VGIRGRCVLTSGYYGMGRRYGKRGWLSTLFTVETSLFHLSYQRESVFLLPGYVR
jgi:hypothetical protein